MNEKLEDVTKYRSMIGGILYLCASRPDIMYASAYLSRYMTSPLKQHLQEAKRVLRYVKGTLTYGIHFKRVEEPELVGFSDSDWGGSVEDKKSTSGYVFTMERVHFVGILASRRRLLHQRPRRNTLMFAQQQTKQYGYIGW